MTRRELLTGAAAMGLIPTLGSDEPKEPTRAALQENLKTQILDKWYPRAAKGRREGFHQTYSNNWNPKNDGSKSVVYQSRLTWVAATRR
ncbi:MAG: hypothetical protein ABJA67_16895 [Chthonomonadales bacterium]